MNRILIFLGLFCINVSALENCNSSEIDKKYDTKLVSNLTEEERCEIGGVKIEYGFCITTFYMRLPKTKITSYAIDFKKSIALSSEGISRPKKIKLSKKQLAEIECLAYSVWAHKNLYPERKRKIEEELGSAPTMLSHEENDLLTFSFHYSQYLTLVDGVDAKVFGGHSVDFTGEAENLYNYVSNLYSK